MAKRFIGITDVTDRVGLSKTEIYRRIAAGTFPRQVPLGVQRVAFLEAEIDAWIAARVEARDLDEGKVQRRARAVSAQGARRGDA